MKLLILGATGATGRHLVDQALAAGHEVTVLVRDAAGVTTRHPKLTVVAGRATVEADVDPVVRGQDAVLSTLGPRSKSDTVCPEAAQALVTAMKAHGVKRVIWLSASGVGDSRQAINDASFVFGKIIIPLLLSRPYANHAAAEEILRASGLDWTVLRPMQLIDVPTGKSPAAVSKDTKPPGLKVARQDVAAFMLRELAEGTWIGQMPLVYA